jgi:hypothetical protein
MKITVLRLAVVVVCLAALLSFSITPRPSFSQVDPNTRTTTDFQEGFRRGNVATRDQRAAALAQPEEEEKKGGCSG